MKFILSLALLILSAKSFCQHLSKTLIIDSLITPYDNYSLSIKTKLDSSITNNFKVLDSFLSKGLVQDGDFVDKQSVKLSNLDHKMVVFQIALVDSSSIIDLQLDDSGGVFSIKRAYFLKNDTIKVNKMVVHHNCFSDTIKSNLSWYRHSRNDTGKNLKLLKSKTFPNKWTIKNCVETIPTTLSIFINERKYDLLFSKQEERLGARWSHGHKKMNRRQEQKFINDKIEGKPYTYFAKSEYVFKYHLYAEVNLK